MQKRKYKTCVFKTAETRTIAGRLLYEYRKALGLPLGAIEMATGASMTGFNRAENVAKPSTVVKYFAMLATIEQAGNAGDILRDFEALPVKSKVAKGADDADTGNGHTEVTVADLMGAITKLVDAQTRDRARLDKITDALGGV